MVCTHSLARHVLPKPTKFIAHAHCRVLRCRHHDKGSFNDQPYSVWGAPHCCGGFPLSTPSITPASSRQLTSGARSQGSALLVSLILWYLPNSEPQSRCNIDDYEAKDMERLDLRNCEMTALPRSIRDFSAVTHLDLGGNHLTTLPPLPRSIEVLFLLGNEFRDIPDSVLGLPRLRMLSFKQCKLTRLGAAPLPTSLRWLILSNNQLTSLPDWIGNLKHVRKLM